MSKFNKVSEGKTSVVNHVGARSFEQSKKEELVFSVVASFIEDSYYESKDERIKRISDLVKEVAAKDPVFVAKLAYITRTEFHMRSAFHVLISELARVHRKDSLVRNTINKGTERVDDLLEIVAYIGKPLPAGVKKGIADALRKFDAYQLAKYRGENKDFSLVDLFNLIHPIPATPEQETAWAKLMKGELKNTETWESKLSAGGKHEDVWADLLKGDKLNYMALLRNLRNILDHADEETIVLALKKLTNPAAVRGSKQLPFRFLSAYKAIKDGSESYGPKKIKFEKQTGQEAVFKALETAVSYSVDNIPLLSGKTMILSDNSGSMTGDMGGSSALSAMSNRKTADIANLFAVMYWLRAENTYVGLFGDNLVNPKLDREKGLFENFDIINNAAQECGVSTEAGIFEAFRELIRTKEIVDRIVIFSDCQVGERCAWFGHGAGMRGGDFNKLFQQYRTINPKAMVYCVDLKGYGNTLFAGGVMSVAGWSDKIFELMQMCEKQEGMVKWIESYPVDLLSIRN